MKNEAVYREKKWEKREERRANGDGLARYHPGSVKERAPTYNPDRGIRGRTFNFIIFDEVSGEEQRTTGVAPADMSPRQLKKARMRVMKEQTAQREAMIEHRRKLQAELDEQRSELGFGEWG